MKKFSKTKNERQVYRTLHTLLLGGQRVVSTGSAIVTKLQSFRYEGDHKNFNFDKYLNLHIEQHNQHADLQEYRGLVLILAGAVFYVLLHFETLLVSKISVP